MITEVKPAARPLNGPITEATLPDAPPPLDERVLIFAPTGRDADLTCQVLAEADLRCEAAADMDVLVDNVNAGAGAILLAEEALSAPHKDLLLKLLQQQQPWSDLPLIVFARKDESMESILHGLGMLGNLTILERPIRITTLVTAVKSALRARRRQYEVRDLLKRLSDASQAKDQFLAMLGHELRNPLAAIRNSLRVMELSAADENRSASQRAVIERQTHYLSRMVDDLLDVSRVTMGKITLAFETLDLRAVVERSVESLRGAALEQGHTLTFTPAPDPIPVDGDPVRLEQVATNLISNAIKYTLYGGHIAISVACVGSEAVLEVQDDGLGIDREVLATIFDLFAQAETSLDRSKGGLGLGLTLVKNLVEMHHGQVTASSDGLGTGSRFMVRLPLSNAVIQDGCRPEPAEPSSGTRRVLVIEDNPDGRETLRELLELWGHSVAVAPDGAEGLRLALDYQPEVVLVDIGLPGLDGYEVARRLRARLDGASPLLIAMSGYGQPEDRQQALEAGFDQFMVKPLEPEQLARALVSKSNYEPHKTGAACPRSTVDVEL